MPRTWFPALNKKQVLTAGLLAAAAGGSAFSLLYFFAGQQGHISVEALVLSCSILTLAIILSMKKNAAPGGEICPVDRKAGGLLSWEEKFRSIADWTYDWEYWVDPQGRFIYCSPSAQRITGYRAEEFMDDPELLSRIVHSQDRPRWQQLVPRDDRHMVKLEFRIIDRGNEVRWIEHICNPIFSSDGRFLGRRASCRNITERQQLEHQRECVVELLRICASAENMRELMQWLTGYFMHVTGCEAVGIRLHEGNDFPYFETRGFPESFVLKESSLCALDAAGEMLRDSGGNPLIECMCGTVLCGRFDPGKPFFTPNGSFWTNSTTGLLELSAEAQRQSCARNRCNSEGYESVALIPLRWKGEIFGLIQLNDRQPGRFSAALIEQYEIMVNYIAIAFSRLKVDEEVRAAAYRSSLSSRMLEVFLTRDDDRVYEDILKILLELCSSSYGVFGYFTRRGNFVIPAITAELVGAEVQVFGQDRIPHSLQSNFKQAIKQKKTLFVNFGHPVLAGLCRIENIIAVPILFRDKVISILQLANKPGGYTARDAEFLENTAKNIAPVLHARLERDLHEQERSQADADLKFSKRLVEASNSILRQAILCETPAEVAGQFLSIIEKLTDSRFGLVSQLNENGRHDAIALSAPGRQPCDMGESRAAALPKDLEIRGFGGRVIRQQRSLIVNAPEAHPDRIGLPQGHPHISCFLGTPLKDQGKVFGLVALINKKGGYRAADIRSVEQLAEAFVAAYRRKQAEEQTRASLREKEMLLREIHHRVKNNLTVVSSLLDLQASYFSDAKVLESFRECKSRIASMTLIHNTLYQSKNISTVDMKSYMTKLTDIIGKTYVQKPGSLSVELHVDDIVLDCETAIPCGLILNELFTNALKHAFPSGVKGAVRIDLTGTDDGSYAFCFSDNGSGIPEEVDLKSAKTLGLQLVEMLSRQLGGTVEVLRHAGTTVRILFKGSARHSRA